MSKRHRDNPNNKNINELLTSLLKKYTKNHIEILYSDKNSSAVLLRHKQNGQPFSKIEWSKRRPHKCSQPFWMKKKDVIEHLEILSNEEIFHKIVQNPVLMSATFCPQCWNEYPKYLKLVERWQDENFESLD